MKISSIVVPQTLSKLLYFILYFSLHCWTVLPSLDTLSPCSPVKNLEKKSILGRAEKAQTYDEFLRGRQIAHMICEHFRETGTTDSVLEFSHCVSISLRGDDVQ